jgi:hypothetical protein
MFGRFKDLAYPLLVKRPLINGYGADILDLGEQPATQMDFFQNSLSGIKDSEMRAILMNVTRSFFVNQFETCWLLKIGPDTSIFIKFLYAIYDSEGVVNSGVSIASLTEPDRINKQYKEELLKIVDFEQIKKKLLATTPHLQPRIELLRKMSRSNGFGGVCWISEECSFLFADLGILTYEREGVRQPCGVALAVMLSFNSEKDVNPVDLVSNDFSDDIRDSLWNGNNLDLDQRPRQITQARAESAEEDRKEANAPRSPEARIKRAKLLFSLKRSQEAQNELKKALAEKPNIEEGKVLLNKILATSGFPGPTSSPTLTEGFPKSSVQTAESSTLRETNPLIYVNSPLSNQVYSARTPPLFDFRATDHKGSELEMKASITDSEGVSFEVAKGLPLPPRGGRYVLTLSATDNAQRSSTLSIPFVVQDLNLGKMSGYGSFMVYPQISGYSNVAYFGFVVSKSIKEILPSGYLDFNLVFPKISLKVKEINWLVLSSGKGSFQGIAVNNNSELVVFRVEAVKGSNASPNHLRVMIWDTANTSTNPIYDLQGDCKGGKLDIKLYEPMN